MKVRTFGCGLMVGVVLVFALRWMESILIGSGSHSNAAGAVLGQDVGVTESGQAAAAAQQVFKIWQAEDDAGAVTIRDNELVYRWSKRLLRAEQSIAKSKDEKIAAATAHQVRMARSLKVMQAYVDVGNALGTPFALASAKFYAAEADEILKAANM